MEEIRLTPIGIVRNGVRDVVDDVFGGLRSRIELDPNQFSSAALLGLDAFSHVEVLFHMNRVPQDSVETGARHPRGRGEWPRTGIFAQRAKFRPNRIGATVCRLLAVNGLSIEVESLDALDGTPVLDLKPYFREFGPRGEVRQPAWATELMSGYWGEP